MASSCTCCLLPNGCSGQVTHALPPEVLSCAPTMEELDQYAHKQWEVRSAVQNPAYNTRCTPSPAAAMRCCCYCMCFVTRLLVMFESAGNTTEVRAQVPASILLLLLLSLVPVPPEPPAVHPDQQYGPARATARGAVRAAGSAPAAGACKPAAGPEVSEKLQEKLQEELQEQIKEGSGAGTDSVCWGDRG